MSDLASTALQIGHLIDANEPPFHESNVHRVQVGRLRGDRGKPGRSRNVGDSHPRRLDARALDTEFREQALWNLIVLLDNAEKR